LRFRAKSAWLKEAGSKNGSSLWIWSRVGIMFHSKRKYGLLKMRSWTLIRTKSRLFVCLFFRIWMWISLMSTVANFCTISYYVSDCIFFPID
jgi:hypothetical protein